MKDAPIEWLGLLGLVVATDVYYYKTKKRSTLSNAVKTMHKDPVLKSLSWALWGWLTYHFFFEKDGIG